MTAIIISSIICGTIVILFVSCLIYDYRIKTADIRSVKRFEKAFGETKYIYIPNHEKTPAPESEKTADSGESLDFPNSRTDLTDLTEKYH